MPKLFHRNEWFFELSPTALSEAEFEEILIQNAELIRPNATIVPYKKTVYAGDNSAKADFAIIANSYRYWFVVEVEMIRHSLYGHVIPQIRTLREAMYDQDDATYLASKNTSLDSGKLSDMLRGESPDVIVLVNKYDEEWARELKRYGAHMMVFEIYRSELNKHIFAIDGDVPRLPHDVLSELSFSFLPRCLTVGSPAALEFKPGEKASIFVDGQLTHWERYDTATECYLSPIGHMPVQPGQKYGLFLKEEGFYEIRPMQDKGEEA